MLRYESCSGSRHCCGLRRSSTLISYNTSKATWSFCPTNWNFHQPEAGHEHSYQASFYFPPYREVRVWIFVNPLSLRYHSQTEFSSSSSILNTTSNGASSRENTCFCDSNALLTQRNLHEGNDMTMKIGHPLKNISRCGMKRRMDCYWVLSTDPSRKFCEISQCYDIYWYYLLTTNDWSIPSFYSSVGRARH